MKKLFLLPVIALAAIMVIATASAFEYQFCCFSATTCEGGYSPVSTTDISKSCRDLCQTSSTHACNTFLGGSCGGYCDANINPPAGCSPACQYGQTCVNGVCKCSTNAQCKEPYGGSSTPYCGGMFGITLVYRTCTSGTCSSGVSTYDCPDGCTGTPGSAQCIPEFTSLGAGIALIGAGAGYALIRKKRK